MTLKEAINKAQNDPNVAIYADAPFRANSKARIGPTLRFTDNKCYVGSGDSIHQLLDLIKTYDDLYSLDDILAELEVSRQQWNADYNPMGY